MKVIAKSAKKHLLQYHTSAFISATDEVRNVRMLYDKSLLLIVPFKCIHRVYPCKWCRKWCRKPANWVGESHKKYFFFIAFQFSDTNVIMIHSVIYRLKTEVNTIECRKLMPEMNADKKDAPETRAGSWKFCGNSNLIYRKRDQKLPWFCNVRAVGRQWNYEIIFYLTMSHERKS